jgi:hypothetical protein
MDTEQDHEMVDSDGSLAGSMNPPYSMTQDVLTNEETDSILKALPWRTVADYKWMHEKRSRCHEWSDIEGAKSLTEEIEA